jgi:hypothetical protein
MIPVNVGTLQYYVDLGRLIPSDEPWTMKDLIDAGVTTCSSVKHGMKLLAKGRLMRYRIHIWAPHSVPK